MNTQNPFYVSTAAPNWATQASLAVTRGTPETATRWAYAVPGLRISQKVSVAHASRNRGFYNEAIFVACS